MSDIRATARAKKERAAVCLCTTLNFFFFFLKGKVVELLDGR